MKKPYHWKKEENENRSILCAVSLLKPSIIFTAVMCKMDREELDSAVWGVWVCESKKLRPYVYSTHKAVGELISKMIKSIRSIK